MFPMEIVLLNLIVILLALRGEVQANSEGLRHVVHLVMQVYALMSARLMIRISTPHGESRKEKRNAALLGCTWYGRPGRQAGTG